MPAEPGPRGAGRRRGPVTRPGFTHGTRYGAEKRKCPCPACRKWQRAEWQKRQKNRRQRKEAAMRVNVTWHQEDAAILLAARGPLGIAPAARLPRSEWLARAEPAALRIACGLTLATLADALAVPKQTIWRWETGQRTPRGTAGARYCRVIEGLARHMEVARDE